MISEAKQTAAWLWHVVTNPDVVWVDPETEEEAERERVSRSTRFHSFRPPWMLTAFTRQLDCGCRKRFGLWFVTYRWKCPHDHGRLNKILNDLDDVDLDGEAEDRAREMLDSIKQDETDG